LDSHKDWIKLRGAGQKYFEYSECLDDARLNFLPKCLQDVAGGAGDCAKCVAKCGPKPSV